MIFLKTIFVMACIAFFSIVIVILIKLFPVGVFLCFIFIVLLWIIYDILKKDKIIGI